MTATNPNTKLEEMSFIAVFRRLLRYLRGRRWMLLVLLALIAISAAAESSVVLMMKPLLDEGFINRDQSALILLPLGLLGAISVRSLSNFLSSYTVSYIAIGMRRRLQGLLFAKYLDLPVSRYDTEPRGEFVSRIVNATGQINQAFIFAVTIFPRDIFLLVAIVGILLYYNWLLSLAVLFMVLFAFSLFFVLSKTLKRYTRKSLSAREKLLQIIGETVDSSREIKVYRAQESEIKRFETVNTSLFDVEMKFALIQSASPQLIQFLVALLFVTVVYFSLLGVGFAEASAGTFVAYITALSMLFQPLRRLASAQPAINRCTVAANLVFEYMDRDEEAKGSQEITWTSPPEIHFKGIHFHYPHTRKKVLKGIDFSIPPGSRLALVGRSGSGKTTLVSLLVRFYDAQAGSILVNGVDAHKSSLASLRSRIAYVSQNINLFRDTVTANIAYGEMSDAPFDEVVEVAKKAHADEFIRALPQGYDSVIGDRGLLLSNGQRQRLSIARALLKDAPILVLDEATSALDNESERLIHESLQTLTKNRTTLVIAHRLSTVRDADNIVVINEGKVEEMGTHDELMGAGRLYSQLYSQRPVSGEDGEGEGD